MKRKELLVVCEQLIKSFNPDRTTVDAHADETLQALEPSDRVFAQQVFYGSYRYRELLRALLTQFLNANASRVSRNDYTKFMIVSYLAMFRLDEMGVPAFAALVGSLEPTSMHVLLSYLFNKATLQGTLKDEWTRLLDEDFVQQKIIDKMLRFEPEILKLLEQLRAKAFGRAAAKQSANDVSVEKKPPTVPIAPKITQPRPREAVLPVRIEQQVKAKPVPASLNRTTLADLQTQQQERKAKIQAQVAQKYDDLALFHFESTAKSNLESVRQEVEATRNAQMQFDFKAKPVPAFINATAKSEIKLNTAAILREDALYKKKQLKDAQLIRNYESELRDPMEFYRWQSSMLQQDEDKYKAEVEARRLDMVQAQYEAIEAAHRARVANGEVASQMKATAKEMEAQRLAEEAQLQDNYYQGMVEIKRNRDIAPREAEEKVKDENKKQREELNAFLAAERERKAAEDALEQAQREELIRQIRALDRVHREHVVVFDPTESPQHGLLEQLSLTELKERLQVRKAEQLAWEEERRERILTDKQDKENMLVDKVRNLSRLRNAAASANASHRCKKKALELAKQQQEEATRREGNLKLAEKLTQQRLAREQQVAKLKEEAEVLAKKRMFLGAAKNMLEESHFDQLRRGFEREAKDRQITHQSEAITMETVKQQAQTMRIEFDRTQQRNKRHEEAVKTQLLIQAKTESKHREREEDEMLKSIVRHEKNRFLHAKEILRNRNAYATTQSQALTVQARKTRTTRTSGSLNQHEDRMTMRSSVVCDNK